jgi:PASTA domain-containing protein
MGLDFPFASADLRLMASRLAALLPRLLALTVIWLLGTATYTVAAGGGEKTAVESAKPASKRPEVIVVPDVRRQAYVFAKGILQDAGFAWRVEGSVQGYAANTVTVQSPAPGKRVVDNGAPTVVLRLARNSAYSERGLPENVSPFQGTQIVLASSLKKETPKQPPAPPAPQPQPQPQPQPEPQSQPQPQPQPAETREPDFVVPGAPKEPADELRLPARARKLAERIDAAAKPTKNLVNFWLYQHSWIVYGARYGWADGAEALRILIGIDEKLQRRWDFGAQSERVARKALAYVESNLK